LSTNSGPRRRRCRLAGLPDQGPETAGSDPGRDGGCPQRRPTMAAGTSAATVTASVQFLVPMLCAGPNPSFAGVTRAAKPPLRTPLLGHLTPRLVAKSLCTPLLYGRKPQASRDGSKRVARNEVGRPADYCQQRLEGAHPARTTPAYQTTRRRICRQARCARNTAISGHHDSRRDQFLDHVLGPQMRATSGTLRLAPALPPPKQIGQAR